MNQKDGEKLLKILEKFINTELMAGNRMTEYSGNAIGGLMNIEINNMVKADLNKELLWEECGKSWLAEKENQKNILKKSDN